jgi:hypothetical protein
MRSNGLIFFKATKIEYQLVNLAQFHQGTFSNLAALRQGDER